ncbi:MAG: site-specific integrase [Candidatus Symbiothrix sp.]|nr:site-specific integrase [Candidatus Symbiothrix sp.]
MGNIKKNGKQQPKVKEPIHLRCKPLANGNQSIFLDIYNNGQRYKEYLKLYIVPERTPIDKNSNRQTLELAKTIQAQRIVEMQTAAHGLQPKNNRKANILLTEYIQFVGKEKATDSTRRSYNTLLIYVKEFAPKATLKDVDKKFLEQFIDYLKTAKGQKTATLANNAQIAYLKKMKAVIRKAVTSDILPRNPFDVVDNDKKPKPTTTEIPYLTLDEVKRLNDTPCTSDIKAAYLFACYTGLRFSDIKALNWSQIRKTGNETMLIYKQKKTQKQEYLTLAAPAIEILNNQPHRPDTELVFALWTNENTNKHLRRFATSAGLDGDKVTFHTARHTCATLLLSLEVPIETVSKVLGHSEIRTTQIYAKVLAEQVKEGIHRLDNIFDNH